METNVIPKYDMTDNPTNCCPRFDPAGWDEQLLHFQDKLFIKVNTRSLFHIPLNMSSVFPRTVAAIEQAKALHEEQFMVLSYDPTAWSSEHYFAVDQTVPGHETVRLSGEFLTKVFEGAYKNIPKWAKEMEAFVRRRGKQLKKTYFFYTTCPRCARFYGKNYVVAVSQFR